MNTRSSTMLIDHTQGLKFTESPRWHDGKLWFLDIHDQRIKTAGLDGRLDTALELPFKPNGFGFRRDGSILVGDALQRQIHRWDGTALQPVADLGDITRALGDGDHEAARSAAHSMKGALGGMGFEAAARHQSFA